MYALKLFITHLCGSIDKIDAIKVRQVRQNSVPYMNSELRKFDLQKYE